MQEHEAKYENGMPNPAFHLRGQSPHARGEKKRRDVLKWVFRWGYSSAEVIRQVAGQKAKGYAVGLVKKGWLVQTKTSSGMPRYIYTLSKAGQQEAERLADKLHRYPEDDPYRINQQQTRHYLLAQQSTMEALTDGSIVEYETERMFSELGDKAGEKRPDIQWTLASGKHIGVEIELSAKWDRRLDQFILGIARALKSADGSPPRYARFAVVTDSPAIARRYKEAMQPYSELKLWKRNQRLHWEVEKVAKVPDWLIEKVTFKLLED